MTWLPAILVALLLAWPSPALAGQACNSANSGPPMGLLADELHGMFVADQAARKGTDVRVTLDLDRRHTARLREIVDQYGWPAQTSLGVVAAHEAWLLVLHADHDPAFQKRCLALIEAAVLVGEASAMDSAYLVDRVAVAEKRPQTYGTQFRQVGDKWEPQPIVDPEAVDARRKAVGLGTLAEYRALLQSVMSPSPTPR